MEENLMKIDRVKIKNFKSLKNINITLNNLTLLTGINSMGKSSFIQALLLLKQNKETITKYLLNNMLKTIPLGEMRDAIIKLMPEIDLSLQLNGDYVSLGNRKNILFEEAYDEMIYFVLENENSKLDIKYDNGFSVGTESNTPIKVDSCGGFNLFFDDMQYICTDRVSPSVVYGLSDKNIKKNLIGFAGEYTAHYLAENKNKLIEIEALIHKDSLTSQFSENTSLWLSEITQGIDISSTINPTQDNVSLSYSYKYKDNKTNEYNPLNVGFGVTFVLPVIVAILKAKEGDLIIIENPESHLHPAGQSKVAELCAIASANGVQIIVETHSDHFLNGIRVATKKGILTPEQSKVYYFRKDKDELETKIDEINIDKDGGIDSYPKGFFDQFDDDLDKLITW